MLRALEVHAGRAARARLAAYGWQGEDFRHLIGASGGPKWLILSQLDRVLFGEFLLPRHAPLYTLGSSIGAWRHACLALPDPVAAIDRLERAYFAQSYSCSKPTPDEVSAVGRQMLKQLLGADGAAQLVGNESIGTRIITARGRGLAARQHPLALGPALSAAALANACHRPLLQHSFQRVIFTSAAVAGLQARPSGFGTTQVPLHHDTVAAALHASGSIPFLLRGERDIPGAPPGQYWDGGIIDYHFDAADLDDGDSDGLVLYPHFVPHRVPGWFDKLLPWRHQRNPPDRVVLLCPSRAFVESLPLAKIPDRSDFTSLPTETRLAYWTEVIRRCRELADEFRALLQQGDPLAGVQPLPGQH